MTILPLPVDVMDKSHERHTDQVTAWLKEHVRVLLEPESVTLSDFRINWDRFDGDFRVALDDVLLPDRFRFSLQASGLTSFYLPEVTPPGIPIGYAALDITNRTYRAIIKGLHDTVPKLEGAGLCRTTGRMITFWTPPRERISPEALGAAQARVTTGYSVTIMTRDV